MFPTCPLWNSKQKKKTSDKIHEPPSIEIRSNNNAFRIPYFCFNRLRCTRLRQLAAQHSECFAECNVAWKPPVVRAPRWERGSKWKNSYIVGRRSDGQVVAMRKEVNSRREILFSKTYLIHGRLTFARCRVHTRPVSGSLGKCGTRATWISCTLRQRPCSALSSLRIAWWIYRDERGIFERYDACTKKEKKKNRGKAT